MAHASLLPRQIVAVLAIMVVTASPAGAFDSYWHAQCVQRVGEQYSFTPSAWKIMQLGNFSPDFFGPVSEIAAQSTAASQLTALDQANDPQIRGAALFLHFDNLEGDFRSNSDFDLLFARLLLSTQKLIAGFNQAPVDAQTRNALTLITLGASLHAVQDFYSHSDWIHNDFDHTDVRTVALGNGAVRAPTWFEFRSKHDDPNRWPIQIQSGIYPPPPGVRNTHTHMNHDNSRLVYLEAENPGQPLRSQAEYHTTGPVPARGDDDTSALAHQQLAVNTATAASIEWVALVESNAEAKKAIEAAKRWDLNKSAPRLRKELEAGLLTEQVLSCAAGKWDGDNPPGERGLLCRSVLGRKASSIGGTNSELESQIIGLAANLLTPVALRFTGLFWDIHGRYHILEHLAEGIGSDSGHYNLPKK